MCNYNKRKLLREILDKPIFPREDIDPIEAVTDYLLDNEVEPVVHGRWIPVEYEGKIDVADCSACGQASGVLHNYKGEPLFYNYCPKCGAKMSEKVISRGSNK